VGERVMAKHFAERPARIVRNGVRHELLPKAARAAAAAGARPHATTAGVSARF